MTTTVFIMCAGPPRIINGICTQLLPLNKGMSFLGRQLAQTSEYSRYIVTSTQEIKDFALKREVPVIEPESERRACNSILSTKHLWTDRVVILLGDVIFANKVIEKILNHTDHVMFSGDQYESYALSFSIDARDEIISALSKGAEKWSGCLRYAYRFWVGKSWRINESPKQLRADPAFFYTGGTGTRDCDSPTIYANIIREEVLTHRLDNR